MMQVVSIYNGSCSLSDCLHREKVQPSFTDSIYLYSTNEIKEPSPIQWLVLHGGCLLTRWNILLSQLHQSWTLCTELLVGHCSLGLALFTGLPVFRTAYNSNSDSQTEVLNICK